MEKNIVNKFDSRDVEWILDQFPMAKSKILNTLMKSNAQQFIKLSNYAQKPLLKLFKWFGRRIALFLGLEPPEYEVVRLKEHLVTSTDGGKLATDVYLPKPVFQEHYKAPTLLIRLPYWKDMTCILGYFFASMGYVTVLQDTRGCAHSKPYGSNSFLMYEGEDGLQTLRWISKRFWYNGKIGMWGMSYFGITQLAVLGNNDGLLTCANPGMASFHNIFYHKYGLMPVGMAASVYGVFSSITKNYELESISAMFEDKSRIPDRLSKYPTLNLYNEKLGEKRYLLHYNDLAQLGDIQTIIQTLNEKLGLKLQLNAEDKGEYEKLLKATLFDRTLNPQSVMFPHALNFNFKPTIPLLYIGGHYDMFQEEFWNDYDLIQKEADPDYCKKNYKVVVGPWAHGGMDIAFNTNGGSTTSFSMKKIVELARNFMPMWFFNYFLKKGGKDISKYPPLQIYILNREIWRKFKAWPPQTTELKLFMHGNKANSRFGDGLLSNQEPKEEPADEYDFDPANPVAMKGGRHLFFINGRHDQAKIEERTDVLVYSTEKLKEGVEVIGKIKLIFYASSSAKDTDFTAKLVDVFPNGKKAINILDDGVRARYREGDLENPSFLEPNEVYRFEIDLGTTAIYFPKNHRIRVELSSSNFPRFDINSNLAGEQNDKGYIIAHQKIFHTAQYPSHLILPLYKKY